jgi:hypothetical protein
MREIRYELECLLAARDTSWLAEARISYLTEILKTVVS